MTRLLPILCELAAVACFVAFILKALELAERYGVVH